MAKIKTVVFDMGGVLVDLDQARAIRSYQEIGVTDAGRLINSYQHNGLFLELEDGDITASEFCRQLSLHAGKEIPEEAIRNAWLSIITDVPQYKLDYVLSLREKHQLYLLSNNNPFIMDWARSTDFSAAGRPIDDYFEKQYISYEVKSTKPGREIFDFMLQDTGIRPEETLFIDDGPPNIKTAQDLGFQTYLAINKEDWRKALDLLLKR